MYRDSVLPYERCVTDAVKALGVPVYTHTCGKIGDRLDLMAETGTQRIDTLDPPPLGNVELTDAKRIIGDRLFIKGNMNSVVLLAYKMKKVIAEATACLRAGAPDGGTFSLRVEPWKLQWLTTTAESESS